MAAQEMFLYTSADWKKLQSAARRAAGVRGWEDDRTYGKLPRQRDFVRMPAVDASYVSFPETARK